MAPFETLNSFSQELVQDLQIPPRTQPFPEEKGVTHIPLRKIDLLRTDTPVRPCDCNGTRCRTKEQTEAELSARTRRGSGKLEHTQYQDAAIAVIFNAISEGTLIKSALRQNLDSGSAFHAKEGVSNDRKRCGPAPTVNIGGQRYFIAAHGYWALLGDCALDRHSFVGGTKVGQQKSVAGPRTALQLINDPRPAAEEGVDILNLDKKSFLKYWREAGGEGMTADSSKTAPHKKRKSAGKTGKQKKRQTTSLGFPNQTGDEDDEESDEDQSLEASAIATKAVARRLSGAGRSFPGASPEQAMSPVWVKAFVESLIGCKLRDASMDQLKLRLDILRRQKEAISYTETEFTATYQNLNEKRAKELEQEQQESRIREQTALLEYQTRAQTAQHEFQQRELELQKKTLALERDAQARSGFDRPTDSPASSPSGTIAGVPNTATQQPHGSDKPAPQSFGTNKAEMNQTFHNSHSSQVERPLKILNRITGYYVHYKKRFNICNKN